MRRNPSTTLAGSGLARTTTALPERDMAGEIIGSADREGGWIEDEKGNRTKLPKRRGRPRTGAQTDAERKRKQRQREKDWDWLPFSIISHAGYLIIEASPEDEMPLFDIHRAHIVMGYELQRMMDAHHKDYPGRKAPAGQPYHGTEFETELGEVKVLVLQYPDKTLYIAPAYETPPTTDDVLAGGGLGSLNRGIFLTDAPKGKGKPITGWGHKKGYNKNTSESEPELGDVSADEFTNEDDDDNGPADNPGRWADDQPETKPTEIRPYVFVQEELDEAVEKNDQDNDENESADALKCRICQEVLEGDDNDSTLLFKHLEERHLDEYRRICQMMAYHFEKELEAEKKREQRRLEKQNRCREDHEGMFARQLKTRGPGAYFCECGVPLCQGTHVKQVEEVLTERAAYRDTLSSQQRLDASKRKPAPIYCKYCRLSILVTDYT